MPLNPITGQFEYGGASYDMPTMSAGMAASGMGAVGADVPLAFQMLENMPGITAMALFNARRFANTMEKGGYRDVLDPADIKKAGRTQIRRAGQKRRALRAGAFVPDATGNIVQTASDSRFLFGSRRGATAAGKTPFLKQSIGTNFPRPRNFGRFASLSHLSGVANAGQYTFAQGMSGFVSPMFERTKVGQAARASAQAAGFSDDAALLSGGVLGRLSTMGRSYGATMAESGASSRSPIARRRAAKATKTIQGIDRSLDVMGATGPTMNQRVAATAGGFLTRNFLEDVGTILDEDLIKRGVSPAGYRPFDPTNMTASQARYRTMFEKVLGTGPELDDAMKAINSARVRKTAVQAFSAGERGIAAKLGGRYLAAQYAKVATPVNVIGTASVLYDLSKMAATGIVSAGNFAKEAVKSMQGSMRKPLFGMGYQDNEVAATSRSRGVMAIQNSRLNARSMLGAEASMMAAHFG